MLNVCVMFYGRLCFVFYECASDLRAIFFLLVFNPMCMYFLCVKITNVLCCENNVLYVFLVICGLLIFCFVCFLGIIIFVVFCVCNHLWVIFYFHCVFCLFIVWDECATWLICGWCFMPLDYCCQVQGCESKGVKDKTSWSKKRVAKNHKIDKRYSF